MKVLVTGGAGFIGSFLVSALLSRGHEVTIYDSLDPQVHARRILPDCIPREARFVRGDIRDGDTLARTLSDVEGIIHLAGAVGVAQSQYEVHRYVDFNVTGTACMLDALVRLKLTPEKIVLASSMTCYGEGRYRCPGCGPVRPAVRTAEDVAHYGWEPTCPRCRRAVEPEPITEADSRHATSVYALTKKAQEDLVRSVAQTYGFPFTILRFFNVYGPRQTLDNPYTGVTAIFLNRVKHGRPPVVYEDGRQSRDFVSVHDAVVATALALERPEASGHVVNIGSGSPVAILDVARTIIQASQTPVEPEVTFQFRKGDIRHCYADTTLAARLLGFAPHVTLGEGIRELVEWSRREETEDRFGVAQRELEQNHLVSRPVSLRREV